MSGLARRAVATTGRIPLYIFFLGFQEFNNSAGCCAGRSYAAAP
jgi:hypothetical protein